jgi:hypothetical protein
MDQTMMVAEAAPSVVIHGGARSEATRVDPRMTNSGGDRPADDEAIG